jgi:nucleotide-binding universal stress UspA family protein
MYDTILVPTDGSDEALKGARHAIELAADVGASIHALYVIDLPNAPRAPYIIQDEEEVREEYEKFGEEVTGEVAEMAAEAGVDCQTVLRRGSVNERIVDYAEDEGIDLIVVGTGYRGKLGALIGSTAEKIVRTSTVPVTTVRRTQDEHP